MRRRPYPHARAEFLYGWAGVTVQIVTILVVMARAT